MSHLETLENGEGRESSSVLSIPFLYEHQLSTTELGVLTHSYALAGKTVVIFYRVCLHSCSLKTLFHTQPEHCFASFLFAYELQCSFAT